MSRRPRAEPLVGKAKVVLDAIRGEKTLGELTKQHDVHHLANREDVQLRPPSNEQRFLRKSLHIAAPVDEVRR